MGWFGSRNQLISETDIKKMDESDAYKEDHVRSMASPSDPVIENLLKNAAEDDAYAWTADAARKTRRQDAAAWAVTVDRWWRTHDAALSGLISHNGARYTLSSPIDYADTAHGRIHPIGPRQRFECPVPADRPWPNAGIFG